MEFTGDAWAALDRITIVLAIAGAIFGAVKVGMVPFRTIKRLKAENEQLSQDKQELVDGRILSDGLIECDDVIGNVEDVKARLFGVMKDTDSKTIRVDNFGLDLETVQAMFRYNLKELANEKEVLYRGLIICPDSEAIKLVCKSTGNLCQQTAKDAINFVESQIKSQSVNFDIDLVCYETPPVIHGFLINDEHLFIGFTRFEGGALCGGDSPYLYINRSNTSKFKESLIKTYKTWFEYLHRTGKNRVANQ